MTIITHLLDSTRVLYLQTYNTILTVVLRLGYPSGTLILPIWHCSPRKLFRQEQWKAAIFSEHSPPLKHGLLSHSRVSDGKEVNFAVAYQFYLYIKWEHQLDNNIIVFSP